MCTNEIFLLIITKRNYFKNVIKLTLKIEFENINYELFCIILLNNKRILNEQYF